MGVLGCTRKVTIPHRLSAEPPLHKGAFSLRPKIGAYPGRADASIGPYRMGSRGIFGPGGVKLSGGGKALRKMQHSCIF